jgi:stearoyl-CoA desaturase (delta-9 desaturase)
MSNKVEPNKLNPVLTPVLAVFHGIALYGFYLLFTGHASWQLILYQFAVTYVTGLTFGTADYGMWSHRAFIPNVKLRILLMILHTLTLQGPLYFWIRAHRLHHKQSDAADDGKNAIKGVLHAHIGWLFLFDEKQFLRDLSTVKIEVEDIKSDKIVMWQQRNYIWMSVVGFALTTLIPLLFGWETSILQAIIATVTSAVVNLHVACWTNMWGTKSYERSIGPVVHEIIHFLTYGMGRVC